MVKRNFSPEAAVSGSGSYTIPANRILKVPADTVRSDLRFLKMLSDTIQAKQHRSDESTKGIPSDFALLSEKRWKFTFSSKKSAWKLETAMICIEFSLKIFWTKNSVWCRLKRTFWIQKIGRTKTISKQKTSLLIGACVTFFVDDFWFKSFESQSLKSWKIILDDHLRCSYNLLVYMICKLQFLSLQTAQSSGLR